MLSGYRVQMCQYHQLRILQRYLTRNPELPESIELLSIMKMLINTDKESFIGCFDHKNPIQNHCDNDDSIPKSLRV
jgi:hypothetical protein